jgi:antitoxin component HigA of HigAB toxin-antitoxin module
MTAATPLDFSTPHVLRNAREYRRAVAGIDRLLDAGPRRGSGRRRLSMDQVRAIRDGLRIPADLLIP